jgi:hypothetical protein
MPATHGPVIGSATALQAAEDRARHEGEIGHPDRDWYAPHMVCEQSGRCGMADPMTIS